MIIITLMKLIIDNLEWNGSINCELFFTKLFGFTEIKVGQIIKNQSHQIVLKSYNGDGKLFYYRVSQIMISH